MVPWDQSLYDANLAAVYDHLTKGHGFQLSNEDKQVIAQGFDYFADGPSRFWTTPNASYSRLMESTDHEGHNWSYLATEENFRRIQDYQKRNLIEPLVGDFAGPKAIRAIGQYAREHNAVVNVFYTSNVDEYLFQDRRQDAFYANVSTLPLDASSTMIRVVAGPGGGRDGTFQIAQEECGPRCRARWPISSGRSKRRTSRTDVNRFRGSRMSREPNTKGLARLCRNQKGRPQEAQKAQKEPGNLFCAFCAFCGSLKNFVEPTRIHGLGLVCPFVCFLSSELPV
jgi:hypothetical protein